MKNAPTKRIFSILSLVLVLTLVLGLSPLAVSAENVEEESHKLADLFYEKIVYEYYDDVYATVYDEAVKNGLFDKAIAQVDDLIAQVEEAKAQIPADVPEEIPEDAADMEVPEDWYEQIPEDVLDRIPEDVLEDLKNKYGNGNTSEEETEGETSDYAAYVATVNQLREETDLALSTLNEIKAILSGDDLTTYEGLLESFDYLTALLRDTIDRIELLWIVLAEDPDNQIDPEQLLEVIDILEKVQHTLEVVYDEIYNARYDIAEVLYQPMCELLEIFLDTQVDSADAIVDAIGTVQGMSEEEIKARIDEIIYDATHADYEITNSSYYVAFGNITDRSNYVKMLAGELDVDYVDHSNTKMTIEQLAESVATYTADIEKADLITINFSEVESVLSLIEKVGAYETEYGVDWVKYLGKDAAKYEEKIDAVLADLYVELEANGVAQKDAETCISAVEYYLYQYVVYACNVHSIVSDIQQINPDALIVVVGVYNPFTALTYTYEDTTINIGSYLDYLFGGFGVYDLVYSILYDGVIFVDTPDVDVKLDENELTSDLVSKLTSITLQPSEDGHQYIQEQIWNALNITRNTECEHKYESVVTAPTCVDKGYTTHTCSLCGHSYVDSYVDALGHKYESVVTAPTCTEAGYTTHTCSVCGDSYVDSEVPANGHKYESVVTEATCTEAGYTTHTCSVCGDSYVDSHVDALGHDWHWVIDKEATETEDGLKHEHCDRCGEDRNSTVIPATGNPKDGDTISVFFALMAISAAGAAVVIKKKD